MSSPTQAFSVDHRHRGWSIPFKLVFLRGGAFQTLVFHPDPKILLNNPPPLLVSVEYGSPFCICSSIQSFILFLSLRNRVSVILSVTLSLLRPPNPINVGILVTPHSTPRSIMFPLLRSGLSSSTSVNARAEYLSCGSGVRFSTREVRSGVMTRQGAQQMS